MGCAELTVEDALFHIFDFQKRDSHYYVNTLQIEQVKKAFRKKVKLYHPDKAAAYGEDERCLESKFKQLHDSYDLLLSLLKKREVAKRLAEYTTYSRPKKYKNPAPRSGVHTRKQKPFKKERGGSEPVEEREGPGRRKTFFYSGAVPARPLRFAEYLFYTGKIDWMTLIDALVWQYKTRPRIGDLACNLGLLDTHTVLHILKSGTYNERFGETAKRFGVLTEYELQRVLHEQKKFNLPIGRFFIKKRIFDDQALYQKIVENKVHNLKYKESTI